MYDTKSATMSIIAAVVAGSIIFHTGDAFAPTPPRWTSRSKVSTRHPCRHFTSVEPNVRPSLAAVVSNDDDETAPADRRMSPLSRNEIQNLLNDIPVYAVTESDGGSIVLLNESGGNTEEIAYFFLDPEAASIMYSPLKSARKTSNVSWDVTQLSLGAIWFDLMENPAASASSLSSAAAPIIAAGVEYRLAPDSRELAGARNMLQQQQGEEMAPPNVFRAAHNEIPIFFDRCLRVEGPDGTRKVPMHMCLEDLISTCRRAAAATGGDDDVDAYLPEINIIDLRTLVGQMMAEDGSEVDFRKVILVPSSAPPPPPRRPSDEGDVGDKTTKLEPRSEEINALPTVTDAWA